MVDFKHIYSQQADAYQHMITYEDYQQNLLPALQSICDFHGANVVEFGAGTGRLTMMLAPIVASIVACDISAHMLHVASNRLNMMDEANWLLGVADNAHIPIATNNADISIEGWSFGHLAGWFPDTWRQELGNVLAEMQRITCPGGTAIILETLGTGYESPKIPTPELAELYHELETQYGFTHQWIRTDYRYDSPQHAAEATRFFFGDELADWMLKEDRNILPECTGIWHRTY